MLRVLCVTAVAALIGLAAPTAAVDAPVQHCSGLTLAFTETDDTHVDLYVTEVVDLNGGPESITTEWVHERLARAIADLENNMFEPGEVSRGEMVAQFELQIAQHDEPPLDGIRFTYVVNVSSCTGI